ncbi:MAG: sterol desaturase family protein [Chitinophagia bacterium]|jgi:sterol desaturase/sphingolipid hydroxylase (fatty acid hydroxylase superfamily)|nr:sterol desaturase family protein [Chitinophagia bacterium]
METYGKILMIAMPLFLILVLFEKWYGWKKGFETVHTLDMISSLSSGVTNSTKDVLGMSVAILSYSWLEEHLALTHIQSGFWVYFIAFITLDFAGYWVHRNAHTFNFFWNSHIVHHSSEEFNLACALRQSISVFFRIFAFLLLPAAIFGVSPKVIAIVAPLHLFAQFWYHTRHIKNMGWLEYIIVTPSHHRVHHAINPEYLDKNYGQVLIIWDRWFGTFVQEKEDIPAVYGITRPVRTWNPIKINFMHLWLLAKDAYHAKSWKDKFRIWMMPLGWRPQDVIEQYPVYKIEDVFDFEKYHTPASSWMKSYLWFQLFCMLLIVSYLYGNVASIGHTNIFIYGGFIFVQVYALTELMDRNKNVWILETIKNIAAIYWILHFGDWFGSNKISTWIAPSLIIYFIASTIAVIYFSKEKMNYKTASLVN